MTDPSPAPATVTVSRDRLLRGVLLLGFGAELLFFVLDATVNHAGWAPDEALQRLVNSTREDALPSWFGVTQTFLVGLTALWVALAERGRGSPAGVARGWTLVGAIFVYLAMDDGSAFHERFGTWLEDMPEGVRPAWFPSYGWQVLFLPVFASMGLYLLVFLGRQLADLRARLAVLGAMGLLGTAIVMDFVEGLARDHALNVYDRIGRIGVVDAWSWLTFDEDGYEMVLHFGKSTEECLEMAAMTLLWWVFLRHVTARAPDQRWTFT